MTAEPSRQQERRIVVAVDGSDSSKKALAWAVRQSRLTGAVVDAVIAWDYPNAYGYAVPILDVDFAGLATKTVTDAIAGVPADAEAAAIRHRVIKGNAARVLVDASAGADLLVVGSRGHGGFMEALIAADVTSRGVEHGQVRHQARLCPLSQRATEVSTGCLALRFAPIISGPPPARRHGRSARGDPALGPILADRQNYDTVAILNRGATPGPAARRVHLHVHLVLTDVSE